MALPGIPAWEDQVIALFHGATDADLLDINQSVDETKGAALKDFGRGFYTTTRLDKAQNWAHVRALRSGGIPAVIRFEVSR